MNIINLLRETSAKYQMFLIHCYLSRNHYWCNPDACHGPLKKHSETFFSVLVLGRVKKNCFTREDAAIVFSKRLNRRVLPEEINFGLLRERISDHRYKKIDKCWFYGCFFLEIGASSRFGFFDEKLFYRRTPAPGTCFKSIIWSRRRSMFHKYEVERYLIAYSTQKDENISISALVYDEGRPRQRFKFLEIKPGQTVQDVYLEHRASLIKKL